MKKSNKKLNKKGFTLIELLAVIVILAVVLSITIPSVLNSMAKARESSLQNAADSVAEWFTKQYELAELGSISGDASAEYKAFIGTAPLPSVSTAALAFDKSKGKEVLEIAGISNAETNIDLANSKVYYNSTKQKACVTLAAKDGGSFYNNPKDNTDTRNTKSSSGC